MIELRGQSFVVRQNDGGAIELLDHLGHGEGFSGAGDAEENLVAVSVGEAADEPGDGFGLVAAGLVVAGKLEFHGGPPLGRKLECSKLFIIRYLSKGPRPGQKAQFKARRPHIFFNDTETTEKA